MFKVGEEVVCINDNFEEQFKAFHIYPVQGDIYTVRDCFRAFAKGGFAVVLSEITNSPISHPSGLGTFEPCFAANRFRSIAGKFSEEGEEEASIEKIH